MPDALLDLLLRRETATAPPLDPATQDKIATAEQARTMTDAQKKADTALGDSVQFLLGLSPIPLGDDSSRANRGGQLVGTAADTIPKLLGVGAAKMALMPLASPVRDPAWRANMLEKLATDAAQVSPQAKEAVEAMNKKYPHLMAHVEGVRPINESSVGPGVAGGFTPNNDIDGGGTLSLNSKILNARDAQGSIAHELQHTADSVKIADRLRQRNLDDSPGKVFSDMYRSAGDYRSNPFETRARTAESAQAIPRQDPGRKISRQQAAVDQGRDMHAEDARVAAKFGLWDQVIEALRRQAMRPSTAPEPPSFSDLLAYLDSSKFGR